MAKKLPGEKKAGDGIIFVAAALIFGGIAKLGGLDKPPKK